MLVNGPETGEIDHEAPETPAAHGPAPLPERPIPPVRTRLGALSEVVLCSGYPTQILLGLGLAVAGVSTVDAGGDLSLTWVLLLSLGDTVLVIALVLALLRRRDERPSAIFLGDRPLLGEVRLGLLLVPVALGVAITGLGTLQVLWPDLRNVPQNPLEALLGSTTGVVAFLGVAVFAGAVREELQRAFVLHRFDQSLGGGWLGVVVFSLAFGLGHRLQGWDATIVTGLLGALWGATYLLRRSVVASMISHAGFNVIEIVMVLAWTDRAV